MTTTTHLRTITLTERVAGECRLTPADVEFLWQEHRTQVKVAPTGRRGWYRLTPAGYVGTLVGPACRLILRPKIPIENLFFLLDAEAPEVVAADHASVAPGAEVFDFLAGRLARLLTERAAAGLHRAYVERTDQGPYLQGRLDVPAHLRAPQESRDRLHCRFEDFSVDVPWNQVPKATAEQVLRCPFLSEEVRGALRRALSAFAGVQAIPLEGDSFRAAEPGPLTEAYRPLLDLCRFLVDGLTRRTGAGASPYPAFLLDMERVFERYLARHCTAALDEAAGGRYRVSTQPYYPVSSPAPGQPDLHIRPDLVIHLDQVPVVVLDSKWKRLPKSSLINTDVYQVLAYVTVLGVREGVVVYPGRRNQTWQYPVAGAPIRLTIQKLQVTGSREACLQSVRRLARRFLLRA